MDARGLQELRSAAAESPRPRVLVLDEEVPWPTDTGKKIRSFNLLRRLADSFEIELLVHDSAEARDRAAAVATRGIQVHIARGGLPPKHGPAFWARLAANVVSPDPYSVTSHHRAGFREALERLLTGGSIDLVHCEWTPYARYLDRIATSVPVVVAAHNVEAQVWRRLAAGERSAARRAFVGLQARKMDRFERRVFGAGRTITAVSDGDAARIRAMGGRDVHVVPNGVDLETYPRLSEQQIESGRVVFTGSMDWRPNQEGIAWFVDDVRPLLPERTRATIVGRRPPAWLRARVEDCDGVELTGSVPDVLPYLARAEVVVVPLRSGGGSRLKILEAFAAGRAVVSTTVGAEGLAVQDERELLLADEPAAFAAAIARLAGDARLRRRLVDAGRALVEDRYDWDRIAARQASLWRRLVT